MPLSMGQSSGGFDENRARVQAFHVGIRNSTGILTPDAFTQANPIVTTVGSISTTLSGITSRGVLGGSIAFTRPDIGNGFIGGPGLTPWTKVRPLGIFINDAVGNAFENTPGIASGRGPYFSAMGTHGCSIYETHDLDGSGGALLWSVGDSLYASRNGLLTNSQQADNLVEGVSPATTIIGVVKIVPDANNSLLVFDLRI